MTPEQLDAIQATARAVEAEAERFSMRFYERLFALAPETRAMFPEDMTAQRGKLVDELVFLADAAGDLPAFTERARELGSRHQTYGVQPQHYDMVCAALLGSLAEVLGAGWTAENEQAWDRLYRLIAETMLEGAAGSLFAPSR
jgi:hemoglobin-like flavoprotein